MQTLSRKIKLEETGKRLAPSLHSPGVTRGLTGSQQKAPKFPRRNPSTTKPLYKGENRGATRLRGRSATHHPATVRLTPFGTRGAGEAGSCGGTPSPPTLRAFGRALGLCRRWERSEGGLTEGSGGHLLLVVQLAVELLVAVEAGGLQGLLAGRALDALLMPQAVVQAQQEPVRNNSLAPFAHRLGGRGSACGKGPGGRGGWRETWMGRRDRPRDGQRIPLLSLSPCRLEGPGACGALRRDSGGTRAIGELRGEDIAPNFVPLGKAAAEPRLGKRAIVRNRY